MTARLFVLIWLTVNLPTTSTAKTASADKGRELAKAYLASRAEIWAGEVDITYRHWYPKREESGAWNAGFDDTKHGQRFLHKRGGNGEIWIVRDSTFRYVYEVGTRIARKESPDTAMSGRGDDPPDLQCLGVANSGEWYRRLSLASMEKFLLDPKHEITVGEADEHGHVKVVWRGALDPNMKGRWTREVVIDTSRSYLPLAMLEGVTRENNLPSEPRDGGSSSLFTVDYTATFEWTNVGGTWVPRRWNYKEFSGEQGGEYTFQWKSVNKPLSKDVFSLDSLSLPKGTLIVNNVTGQSFIEKTVGGMPAASGHDTVQLVPKEGMATWLLILNISCIIVIVFLIAYKRYGRGVKH